MVGVGRGWSVLSALVVLKVSQKSNISYRITSLDDHPVSTFKREEECGCVSVSALWGM